MYKWVLMLMGGLLNTSLMAQHATRLKSEPSKVVDNSTKHKVMVIPFEPRLYLSEIDFSINKQTGQSAKEIKHNFRDGLNEQCYKALKSKGFEVLDLMEDTTKYAKELKSIYSNLTYDYAIVPNPDKYKAPEKEKKDNSIQKGQVQVETKAGEKRFMNAKTTNAKLVPLLYGTHKTDIFIFINQLDLKAGNDGLVNTGIAIPNRKITWHYTIYSYDAVELNSGTVELDLPTKINEPKKIIQTYFSQMALVLTNRLIGALSNSSSKN